MDSCRVDSQVASRAVTHSDLIYATRNTGEQEARLQCGAEWLPWILRAFGFCLSPGKRGCRVIAKRHIAQGCGSAFVVVGNNHTLAGGKRVEITTVRLLAEVAEAVGFEMVEEIPMEMLVSREIFKKNAIESESILHLRNPR